MLNQDNDSSTTDPGNLESVKTGTATSSAISDQLFIEMCHRGPMIGDPGSLSKLTGLATRQINWYYLEAALYAARISAGDFSAPKAQRPVFKLKMIILGLSRKHGIL